MEEACRQVGRIVLKRVRPFPEWAGRLAESKERLSTHPSLVVLLPVARAGPVPDRGRKVGAVPFATSAGPRRSPSSKQWGGRNKKAAGRMLDGQPWDDIPCGSHCQWHQHERGGLNRERSHSKACRSPRQGGHRPKAPSEEGASLLVAPGLGNSSKKMYLLKTWRLLERIGR